MPFDGREQRAKRALELDLGGVKQRIRLFCRFRGDGSELEHIDSVERPAVRARDTPELIRCLRERDVQSRFVGVAARKQELQRYRRLTGTRLAVDEIEMPTWQTAAEDVIESDDAGQCVRVRVLREFGLNWSLLREFLRCEPLTARDQGESHAEAALQRQWRISTGPSK